MRNLTQRTLTGLLFSAIAVISILWHELTFIVFFGFIMLLCVIEYHQLIRKLHGKPLIAWEIVLSLLILTGASLYFAKIIPISALSLVLPMFYLVFITELYRRKKRVVQNLALTFLPIIHIAIPISLFVGLGYITNEYNYRPVLAVILMTWAFDTFAYIIGVLIGKNRIAPHISPKKSWEGFLGGTIFSGGLALFLAQHWHMFDPLTWIVISLIISICVTFGDLVESMIKRAAGVKDSGRILPGHGGVLDRFDGFLFAIPFVFGYLYLIN